MDTEAILTCMIATLLLGSSESNIGDKNGSHPVKIEILAYYSIPRFGKTKNNISIAQLKQCLKLIDCVLNEKTKLTIFNIDDNLSTRLRLEHSTVRGTAYPEQIQSRIEQLLGKFDSDFLYEIGITPTKIIQILWGIIKFNEITYINISEQARLNGLKYKEDFRLLNRKERV